MDELRVHVVDQALHVGALLGSHRARRRTGVLKFARLDGDLLQLGPLHQFFIVVPFGDDADGTHDAGVVGEDLAARRGNEIRSAGADRLDGSHNALLLFVTNAQHLAIDFLRSRRSATGRIHVNDDGLDRAVVAVLPQLLDYVLGSDDHAFQVDHANLVAKAAEGVFLLRADTEVNQREDGDQEEEESSSTEQYPEKKAGTRLIVHREEPSLAERSCRLSAVSLQL